MRGKASSDTIMIRCSELVTCDVILLQDGSDLVHGLLKLIDRYTSQSTGYNFTEVGTSTAVETIAELIFLHRYNQLILSDNV